MLKAPKAKISKAEGLRDITRPPMHIANSGGIEKTVFLRDTDL